jgi:phosphoglycolate phosphatase-like HAD superfamily hydrolase
MLKQVNVFDFDGTLTDAEEEGGPFQRGYLEDLSILTGLRRDAVSEHARRFLSELDARPEMYGWEYEGRIVAPANVDPYLRMRAVAERILDHEHVFRDPFDRTHLLELLYRENYPKTLRVFRAGAREIIAALVGTHTYVATNADAETVRAKLRELSADAPEPTAVEWIVDRVYDNARKYLVDDALTEVPAELAVPSLARPVLLRRRRYYELLDALRRRHGLEWNDLRIIGDIFELDGALPLALGAWFGLLVNARTPAYERDFVQQHPRGRILTDLSGAIPFLTDD